MGSVNSPHNQHHPSKQYEKSSISRASTGSNPDNNHYTPKQHQNYHNNSYQSYSKSGGAYSSRKSTDGVQHFNNSARGANQGGKLYQNGRNNRQNNQHNNNSANSNSSAPANVSTESSAVNCQTNSPSSNSNRNKKGQAYSTANNNVSHNTNNAGKNATQSAANNAKTVEATNSDDEAQIQNGGGCWANKKLTFAEILQKKSAAAAASQQQQNQQQDSSISVSSTNSSNASSSQSSQATTPTTVNPAKSFPLALSGTITNIYGNSSAQSDQFDGKNNELIITNNANSSIPV